VTTNDARAAIERHIRDNWKATPIAWPGRPFTPPNKAPWIQPTPLFGDGHEATHEMHATVGVLHLNLFGPKGQGYGALWGHADALRKLFAGRVLEGVRFGAASGPTAGPDPDYLQLVVRVPFEVDEAQLSPQVGQTSDAGEQENGNG
jgi:hypothetical protein